MRERGGCEGERKRGGRIENKRRDKGEGEEEEMGREEEVKGRRKN